MTVERFVDVDGRLRERQVKGDERRELQVARVVSLSPPTVELVGRQTTRVIDARAVGLTVQINDLVLVARVEQGLIAVTKVEQL